MNPTSLTPFDSTGKQATLATFCRKRHDLTLAVTSISYKRTEVARPNSGLCRLLLLLLPQTPTVNLLTIIGVCGSAQEKKKRLEFYWELDNFAEKVPRVGERTASAEIVVQI